MGTASDRFRVLKGVLIAAILLMQQWAMAQSETTQALQKRFKDSFSLFFYQNTLRMLNQKENKEFDDLIKNIEKMKFLSVDKAQNNFSSQDYKALLKGYRTESYEPIVTSRHEGRNMDVYLKDIKGLPLGTVILVNDSSRLYVLDILGSIDIQKASSLFSMLNENTEVSQKMKSFFGHPDGKNDDKKIHIE
jgi:Domain of unknown function (DUF4252)